MTIIIVFRPNRTDIALPAKIEELHRSRRQSDLAHYEPQVSRFGKVTQIYQVPLFCPTVGPILSGGKPGMWLYKVFVFSKNV